MDKYPNLSERAARGILHKMAEEGKAEVIKVKNDKGAGGFILAYRAVSKK